MQMRKKGERVEKDFFFFAKMKVFLGVVVECARRRFFCFSYAPKNANFRCVRSAWRYVVCRGSVSVHGRENRTQKFVDFEKLHLKQVYTCFP